MLIKMKQSFEEGLEKIKWFAGIISERVKVELAVIKLLWQSSDLEKRRDELIRHIGDRVFELRRVEEINVLEDKKISRWLKELEALDKELEEIKRSVSQIGEAEH